MPITTTAANSLAAKLPKAISPAAHAVIDWATFGAFFTAGALLWKKNKRASLAAYLCAEYRRQPGIPDRCARWRMEEGQLRDPWPH